MSEVLSIRIPKELKEKIEELRDFVDWRKEIVDFLWKRVEYYEKLRILKEIEKIMEAHPELPQGLAVRLIKDDPL